MIKMLNRFRRSRSAFSGRGLAIAAGLWLLFASGCRNSGPRGLEKERVNYNLAVQRTNEEQLLLNLVRLRYRDIPFFIKVTSISSQVEWEKGASVNASLLEGGSSTFGIGGALRHMEIPTVTYTPLEGKEFSQTLLSPIAVETLILLVHSGWSIERVLRSCVRQLGPLRNAIGAGGPTPDYVPVHARFDRADRDASVLRIQTRSFLSSLFFLSQGVEVPPEDQEAGLVTITRDSSGEVFDWADLLGELLRVRSGRKPKAAAVAVR
jgi:hypothetical protein